MGLKYYKLCFETMTQGMFAMTPCAVVCDLAHVWKPQFLDCRTAHSLGISKATINWNVSLYNCVCVSSSSVLLQVAVVLGRGRENRRKPLTVHFAWVRWKFKLWLSPTMSGINLSGKPSTIMARNYICYTEAFPMGLIQLIMRSMEKPSLGFSGSQSSSKWAQ